MGNTINYNFLDPAVVEDPYPFFSELLELAPVYQVPGTDVYLISSHKLVDAALRNNNDFSANLTGVLVTNAAGHPALRF